MNSQSDLLWLMQLASPALPVGGFSYSEGLEAAVEHGLVTNEDSAKAWLLDQLHLVQARSELPVVAQAMAAWQAHDTTRLNELNQWVLQTRETFESRLQSEQMGRSMLDWLRNHTTASAPDIALLAAMDPSYPVAFALAAASTEAPVRALAVSVPYLELCGLVIAGALMARSAGVAAQALQAGSELQCV